MAFVSVQLQITFPIILILIIDIAAVGEVRLTLVIIISFVVDLEFRVSKTQTVFGCESVNCLLFGSERKLVVFGQGKDKRTLRRVLNIVDLVLLRHECEGSVSAEDFVLAREAKN